MTQRISTGAAPVCTPETRRNWRQICCQPDLPGKASTFYRGFYGGMRFRIFRRPFGPTAGIIGATDGQMPLPPLQELRPLSGDCSESGWRETHYPSVLSETLTRRAWESKTSASEGRFSASSLTGMENTAGCRRMGKTSIFLLEDHTVFHFLSFAADFLHQVKGLTNGLCNAGKIFGINEGFGDEVGPNSHTGGSGMEPGGQTFSRRRDPAGGH